MSSQECQDAASDADLAFLTSTASAAPYGCYRYTPNGKIYFKANDADGDSDCSADRVCWCNSPSRFGGVLANSPAEMTAAGWVSVGAPVTHFNAATYLCTGCTTCLHVSFFSAGNPEAAYEHSLAEGTTKVLIAWGSQQRTGIGCKLDIINADGSIAYSLTTDTTTSTDATIRTVEHEVDTAGGKGAVKFSEIGAAVCFIFYVLASPPPPPPPPYCGETWTGTSCGANMTEDGWYPVTEAGCMSPSRFGGMIANTAGEMTTAGWVSIGEPVTHFNAATYMCTGCTACSHVSFFSAGSPEAAYEHSLALGTTAVMIAWGSQQRTGTGCRLDITNADGSIAYSFTTDTTTDTDATIRVVEQVLLSYWLARGKV